MSNIIDSLYTDISRLLNQLSTDGDLSMHSFANENLRKVLLLSAASFFETRICLALETFSRVHSNNHPGIQSLIKKKAIDRQYHTHFDWKKKNAGAFFALFGEVCQKQLKSDVDKDADLKIGLTAFLDLGGTRNELVHQNFAAFPFDKTADEVYSLFQQADLFVKFVETRISDPSFGVE